VEGTRKGANYHLVHRFLVYAKFECLRFEHRGTLYDDGPVRHHSQYDVGKPVSANPTHTASDSNGGDCVRTGNSVVIPLAWQVG